MMEAPSYQQTLNELYDLQKFAIKLGLDNIRFLSALLQHPQHHYPVIHIAGTNGKGSTAFFLSQILQAMGLKTGLFTSPHLVDFRERIRVNQQFIGEDYVRQFWVQIKKAVLQKKATFFDTVTAMALSYFKQQKVDVAVVEVGLGGRLDSTNIVQPHTVVFTPIDLDHQKQLGDTLERIAWEKAGIIKEGAAVFSAQQAPAVLQVLTQKIKARQWFYLPDVVDVRLLDQDLSGMEFDLMDLKRGQTWQGLRTAQLGAYQIKNMALAYAVARHFLESKGVPFKGQNFRALCEHCRWAGRLQVWRADPPVLWDVSHNLHGIRNTWESVEQLAANYRKVVYLGLVNDKQTLEIARFLAKRAHRIVVTEPQTHRKLPVEELEKIFYDLGVKVKSVKDCRKGYQKLIAMQKENEMVIVLGSHYLLGAIMEGNFI